jgi:hypothetical protein
MKTHFSRNLTDRFRVPNGLLFKWYRGLFLETWISSNMIQRSWMSEAVTPFSLCLPGLHWDKLIYLYFFPMHFFKVQEYAWSGFYLFHSEVNGISSIYFYRTYLSLSEVRVFTYQRIRFYIWNSCKVQVTLDQTVLKLNQLFTFDCKVVQAFNSKWNALNLRKNVNTHCILR